MQSRWASWIYQINTRKNMSTLVHFFTACSQVTFTWSPVDLQSPFAWLRASSGREWLQACWVATGRPPLGHPAPLLVPCRDSSWAKSSPHPLCRHSWTCSRRQQSIARLLSQEIHNWDLNPSNGWRARHRWSRAIWEVKAVSLFTHRTPCQHSRFSFNLTHLLTLLWS